MREAALKSEDTGKVKAVAKRKDDAVPMAVSESTALISMIERAARDPSVDIDKMQRLFTMQQEATANRARTSYLASFAKLQAELPAVARKGKGHNDKKYARFEDVIETIKKPLSDHGFSLSFRLKHHEKAISVIGVLGHEDGHQEETEIMLPADASGNKNAVQSWGSTISYGRRYVALTLLGIATEDDDDGNRAGAPAKETITEQQAADLKKLMEKASVEDPVILDHFKVKELGELTPTQFRTAVNKLNKKLEA